MSDVMRERGYLLIVGGGQMYDDDKSGPADWAADVYGWMIEKANAGPIVVLDCTDDDLTDIYVDVLRRLGADSATCKIVASTREAADSPSVFEAVSNAAGVFIVGGHPWRYIQIWQNTKVEAAIRQVYQRGGVVAGNSAGAHLLGEFILDTRRSLEEGERKLWGDSSLIDPYGAAHTYTTDFLGLLPGVTVETHCFERGRLARLAASLARLRTDFGQDVIGLGVDKLTAVGIDPQGLGEVLGSGAALALTLEPGAVVHCAATEPLAASPIRYHQLTAGFKYDFTARQVRVIPEYAWAYPTLDPPAQVYEMVELSGTYDETAFEGDVFIDGPLLIDKDAWMAGLLTLREGDADVPGTVIVPKMYCIDEKLNPEIRWTWANQHAGAALALATYPGKVAILLPEYLLAKVDDSGLFWIEHYQEDEVPSVLILDSSQVTAVGLSPHIRGGVSAALVDAMLHIIDESLEFDLEHRVARLIE